MKNFTPYFILLILVMQLPSTYLTAQTEGIFSCELSVALTPIGQCKDVKGNIQVEISNGLGDYTVSWSSFTNNLDQEMQTSENSFTIPELPVGPFAVKVVDNDSKCSTVAYTRIDFDILRGTVTAVGNPTRCNGKGSITVNIDGNTPPYDMKVTGPVSSFTIAKSNTVKIYNLPAGDYEILVDQDGCKQTVNATISAGSDLPSIGIVAEKDDCGVNTGTINANIGGGFGPYSLSWDGPTSGEVTVAGSVLVSGLTTGNYEFILTDAKGCKSIFSIDLNTTSLNTEINSKPAINGEHGFLKVNIAGGVPGYMIAWEGLESGMQMATSLSESISLPAGEYLLTVTDGASCSVSSMSTIEAVTNSVGTIENDDSGTGRSGELSKNSLISESILLHQNYPNPFGNQTIIRFELPETKEVQLTIQDHFGRIISTTKQGFRKGLNQFTLNGQDLSAGMYFYTISTDTFKATKRMVVR